MKMRPRKGVPFVIKELELKRERSLAERENGEGTERPDTNGDEDAHRQPPRPASWSAWVKLGSWLVPLLCGLSLPFNQIGLEYSGDHLTSGLELLVGDWLAAGFQVR